MFSLRSKARFSLRTSPIKPVSRPSIFARNFSKEAPTLEELGISPKDKETWEKLFAGVPDPTYLTQAERDKINWDALAKWEKAQPSFFQTWEIKPGVKFWQYKKFFKPASEDYYIFDGVIDEKKQFKRHYFKVLQHLTFF